jgi:hypothetical protein
MTMTSLEVAVIIQAVLFGCAILGLFLGGRLPSHHLSSETKTVVSTCMAVVGTMSALVISLLISNGNAAFTARTENVTQLASDITQLNVLLERYGPETTRARDALQRYAAMKFEDLFPSKPDHRPNIDNPATRKVLEEAQDLILALRPRDDRQHWLAGQAMQLTVDLAGARERLSLQSVASVPLPFLGAVVLWLAVLFASFGLFAPRNVTAIAAMFCCAFAISAAIKLVLDMNTPIERRVRLSPPPIHITSDPLRRAIDVIHGPSGD